MVSFLPVTLHKWLSESILPSGTIGSELVNLVSEVTEVPGEISNLRKEFDSLKGFLGDAQVRQENDLVVRKWMSDISDLNYEAQEITEKHLHRIARHREAQPDCWNSVIRFPRALFDAMVLAREASIIHGLTNKISRMTSSMEAYGIEYRQYSTADPATESFPLALTCVDEDDERIIIGLDEDIKTVENHLVSVGSTKVVALCGADGLGKTTLAREVLRSIRVSEHFDVVAWAFVGQDFQVKDVLKKILLDLLSIDIDEEEKSRIEDGSVEEVLLTEIISQILQEKRCLVVLDDFQIPETWDRLQTAFSTIPSTYSCSKLVITTCDASLLSYIDARGFLHQLRFLNYEERLQLLLKKVGSSGKGLRGYLLKLFGKHIAKYSIGLPLLILVLGGIWRRDSELPFRYLSDEYKLVNQKHPQNISPGERLGDKSVLEFEVDKVLWLSHVTLESKTLQLCLRRMLDFPLGYEIPTEELFSLWIDNHIVKHRSRSIAEKIAQKCLDELVDMSLVQVVDKNSGRIKSCQLHSVVRDYYSRSPDDCINSLCVQWRLLYRVIYRTVHHPVRTGNVGRTGPVRT